MPPGYTCTDRGAGGAEGYERMFKSIVKAHADALLVPSSPRFF